MASHALQGSFRPIKLRTKASFPSLKRPALRRN